MRKFFVTIALALVSASVAMAAAAQTVPLTVQQLQTVCTAVKADPTANAARQAGDTYALLTWLNGAKSPQTLAWNSAVAASVSDEAANYTTYDSLAGGKRDAWAIFLLYTRDYGKNKVRNWVVDVWGSATSGSVAESILTAATKSATNVQNALGGTSKTTGTVTALDLAFDGNATQSDANWLVNPGNCN